MTTKGMPDARRVPLSRNLPQGGEREAGRLRPVRDLVRHRCHRLRTFHLRRPLRTRAAVPAGVHPVLDSQHARTPFHRRDPERFGRHHPLFHLRRGNPRRNRRFLYQNPLLGHYSAYHLGIFGRRHRIRAGRYPQSKPCIAPAAGADLYGHHRILLLYDRRRGLGSFSSIRWTSSSDSTCRKTLS